MILKISQCIEPGKVYRVVSDELRRLITKLFVLRTWINFFARLIRSTPRFLVVNVPVLIVAQTSNAIATQQLDFLGGIISINLPKTEIQRGVSWFVQAVFAMLVGNSVFGPVLNTMLGIPCILAVVLSAVVTGFSPLNPGRLLIEQAVSHSNYNSCKQLVIELEKDKDNNYIFNLEKEHKDGTPTIFVRDHVEFDLPFLRSKYRDSVERTFSTTSTNIMNVVEREIQLDSSVSSSKEIKPTNNKKGSYERSSIETETRHKKHVPLRERTKTLADLKEADVQNKVDAKALDEIVRYETKAEKYRRERLRMMNHRNSKQTKQIEQKKAKNINNNNEL